MSPPAQVPQAELQLSHELMLAFPKYPAGQVLTQFPDERNDPVGQVKQTLALLHSPQTDEQAAQFPFWSL